MPAGRGGKVDVARWQGPTRTAGAAGGSDRRKGLPCLAGRRRHL